MIDEAIHLEDASAQVPAFLPDPLFQYLHQTTSLLTISLF
jgi:hypothetical protein